MQGDELVTLAAALRTEIPPAPATTGLATLATALLDSAREAR